MVVAKFHTVSGTITQLNKIANSLSGQIDAQLSNIADDIVSDAQSNAKKRTGRMAAMTQKERFKKGNGIGYRIVGKAPYTIYVHEGTSRMQGDPYIRAAFEKHSPKIKQSIQKLFSGGGGAGSGW